jgi:hypothetical protein
MLVITSILFGMTGAVCAAIRHQATTPGQQQATST